MVSAVVVSVVPVSVVVVSVVVVSSVASVFSTVAVESDSAFSSSTGIVSVAVSVVVSAAISAVVSAVVFVVADASSATNKSSYVLLAISNVFGSASY